MTPKRWFSVPEDLLSQVLPLSEEVRIIPESPTVTMVLFPYATPLSMFVGPEVLEVHVVPSDEVNIVPSSPTETYNLVEVVVVSVVVVVVPEELELLDDSSLSLQEKIVRLKRKRERIMSIDLIGFQIG